jgi:hypothetical protein
MILLLNCQMESRFRRRRASTGIGTYDVAFFADRVQYESWRLVCVEVVGGESVFMGGNMRARTKITIGVGLLLLALLLTVIIARWQTLREPPLPLRAGMTISEVQELMGVQDTWLMSHTAQPGASWEVTGMIYIDKTDVVGNIRHTSVYLDDDGRVTHWERGSQSGMRPPWLHHVMRTLGW